MEPIKVDYKKRYLMLLEELEVDASFVDFLELNGFFTAPASRHCHQNYEGGLCEHSVRVYDALVNIVAMKSNTSLDDGEVDEHSLIKLALFHDLGKIDLFEKYIANKKIYCDDGDKFDTLGRYRWESVEAYKYKDEYQRLMVGNPGFVGYTIAKDYVSFSNDEMIALCNYYNVYEKLDNGEPLTMMKKYPLMTYLYLADMYATFVGTGNDL